VSSLRLGPPPGPAVGSRTDDTDLRLGGLGRPGVSVMPRRARTGRDGSGVHGSLGAPMRRAITLTGHDTRVRATGRSSWAGRRPGPGPAVEAGRRPTNRPSSRAVSVKPQVGSLTGPWPALFAGLGRTGRLGRDRDCTFTGAASRRACTFTGAAGEGSALTAAGKPSVKVRDYKLFWICVNNINNYYITF
jgi:hypothetical protein